MFYPLLQYNVLAKEDFCIVRVKGVEHRVRLDNFEHRMLIACVNMARSELIEQGKETVDVDDLLVKIIKAPSKKVSVRV